MHRQVTVSVAGEMKRLAYSRTQAVTYSTVLSAITRTCSKTSWSEAALNSSHSTLEQMFVSVLTDRVMLVKKSPSESKGKAELKDSGSDFLAALHHSVFTWSNSWVRKGVAIVLWCPVYTGL